MDRIWMKKAYAQALKAKHENEVPVGAVIVDSKNQCIAAGHNQVIQLNDPTAHAEVCAVRKACHAINNYRLVACTMYVTLEPCVMCAGALLQSRIQRLVFAARDTAGGACGSYLNLCASSQLNHSLKIDDGVLEKECEALLIDFFKQKRQSNPKAT